MKKKRLIEALALTFLVPLTVHAATTPEPITSEVSADGKTITFTVPSGNWLKGPTITELNNAQYEHIIINKTVGKSDDYAISDWSAMKLNTPNADLTINVTAPEGSYFSNSDAIKGKNWGTYINVKSLTVNVEGAISDVFNPDHGGTPEPSTVNGDMTLTVNGGNGIRTNASLNNVNQLNQFTVKGQTTIHLLDPTFGTNIHQAALYAGDSYFWKTKGRGLIVLEGDSHITLDGRSEKIQHAIFAGRNGKIEVANLLVDGTGEGNYGIRSDFDGHIVYSFDFAANAHGTEVILTGTDYTFEMGKDSKALYASGGSYTDDTQYAKITATDDHAINLHAKGDVVANAKGQIRLVMTDGSYITGSVLSQENGKTNLTFANDATITGSVASTTAGLTTIIASEGFKTVGNISAQDLNSVTELSTGNNSTIQGDVTSSAKGTTRLTLRDNTVIEGQVTADGEASSTQITAENTGNWKASIRSSNTAHTQVTVGDNVSILAYVPPATPEPTTSDATASAESRVLRRVARALADDASAQPTADTSAEASAETVEPTPTPTLHSESGGETTFTAGQHFHLEGPVTSQDEGSLTSVTVGDDSSWVSSMASTASGHITLTAGNAMRLTGTVSSEAAGSITHIEAGDNSVWEADLTSNEGGQTQVQLGNGFSLTGSAQSTGEGSLTELSAGEASQWNATLLADNAGQTRATLGNAFHFTGSAQASGAGSTVTLHSGDASVWHADFAAQDAGTTDATAGANSLWLGASSVAAESTVNVTLGEASTWQVTADSTLTNLNAPNARLDLSKNALGNAQSVTVENTLTGGHGTLVMDLNDANADNKAAGNGSDYLTVKGADSTGTYSLVFSPETSIVQLAPSQKLYFATVNGSGLTFGTQENLAITTPDFLYSYQLAIGNESENEWVHWYIASQGSAKNSNTPIAQGVLSAIVRSAIDIDWMNQRQGDSRYSTDNSGLWVRARYQKTSLDNTLSLKGTVVQAGYEHIKPMENANLQFGMGLDYADEEAKLTGYQGQNDLDRLGVILYSTYTHDSGWYQDTVLRLGKVSADWTYDGYGISGKSKQWYGSLSVEGGRRFDLIPTWYVEPQAQLQLSRVSGQSYQTNYGVGVVQDGTTSVVGRLGVRLGKDWLSEDGALRNALYLRADLLHEFAGEESLTLTGKDRSLSVETSGHRTWFNLGAGMNWAVTPRWKLHTEVNRQWGNGLRDAWLINGGMRYAF